MMTILIAMILAAVVFFLIRHQADPMCAFTAIVFGIIFFALLQTGADVFAQGSTNSPALINPTSSPEVQSLWLQFAIYMTSQHPWVFKILLMLASRGLLGVFGFPIHTLLDSYCKKNTGLAQYAQAVHLMTGSNSLWRVIDFVGNFIASIKPSVVVAAIQIAGHEGKPGAISVPDLTETKK